MQTPTFLRQVSRIRHSWQPAITLLLFAFLFSNSVLGQSITDESVSFSQQSVNSTAFNQDYAGKTSQSPYNGYPKLGNTATNPNTPPAQIGYYDLTANSSLKLIGASIVGYPQFDFNTFTFNGTVTGARIFYRVYLGTVQSTPYSSLELVSSDAAVPGRRTFTAPSSTNIDLLDGLLSGGDYTVDIRFEIDTQNGGVTTQTTDPSNAYKATFNVKSPAVAPNGSTTTWISTSSTDWTLANNWSNGVPTAQSNAVIPEAVQGSNVVFPILDDLNKNYRVKNLTLNGTTASGKAQLTIQNAVLRVYGNLTQEASGLVGTVVNNTNVADSTQNSTLIFAGGNQVVSTGRLLIPDVIAAGSGYKYILGNLVPYNTLSFQPADATAGVIIQTSSLKTNSDGTTYYGINTTGTPTVSLLGPGISNGVINANPGNNETLSSYVSGYLTSGGGLAIGKTQSFGNIGLDLFSNHNSNSVSVVRIIGDPLVGPTNSNGTKSKPIQRQFQITGDDDSTSGSFAGSSNTVTFHYLPSDFELNGIKQKNLTMFRTTTGVAPYTPVGGIIDSVKSVVVQVDLPSFKNYYYTLGDKTNPLPVSLIAFTATRSNQNALLAWATATEQNSAGFEVQVSTDGASFRKLAFVASQSPNSSQKLAYTYTDAEAGKTGIRYYRLRQLDITGEEAFSPVRVVNFDGVAAVAALSAYPNPFADKVAFNLDATAVGTNGNAHIQLLDMTGRIVREQNLTVQNGSLTLDNLSDLRSGLYMVRITLPDGSAKTLRVQKQ